MKTIAKVTGISSFETPRFNGIHIIHIDKEIPGIIKNSFGYERGLVKQFTSSRTPNIGDTIEITTEFHNAGETYKDKIVDHDCVSHEYVVLI